MTLNDGLHPDVGRDKRSAVPPNSLFLSAAKEEEKQKLMKWSSELKLEREQLELRVKQLSNSITVRNKRLGESLSSEGRQIYKRSECIIAAETLRNPINPMC